MPILTRYRSWRRRRMRAELEYLVLQGARVAHLPAFLDRAPRHNLHRALQAAFMRGFLQEQRALLRRDEAELSPIQERMQPSGA